jgi:ABC-type transporter Mla MlaB component
MVVGGRLIPGDLPSLCARLSRLVRRTDAHVVICDVGGLERPDVVAVDALARLQLTAKRLGRRIRLRGSDRLLDELLRLSGLDDVLR